MDAASGFTPRRGAKRSQSWRRNGLNTPQFGGYSFKHSRTEAFSRPSPAFCGINVSGQQSSFGPSLGSPQMVFRNAFDPRTPLPTPFQHPLASPQQTEIFFNRTSYKVFVDPATSSAMIDKDGIPHIVYFEDSKPRQVLIDGVSFHLRFGEQKPITLDGKQHFIAFGAPSREFLVDDVAYKAVFGGAPFVINVCGEQHLVQLSGPLPHVLIKKYEEPEDRQIDSKEAALSSMKSPSAPEPMLTFQDSTKIPQDKKAKGPQTHEEQKSLQDSKNLIPVSELLEKLRNRGFLPTAQQQPPSEAKHAEKRIQSDTPVFAKTGARFPDSQYNAPPPDLCNSWDWRILAVRYSSVLEELLGAKMCGHCGQCLTDVLEENRETHEEEHLKQRLEQKTGRKDRQWYLREWNSERIKLLKAAEKEDRPDATKL
ncbi:hypothetical protein L596_015441 [Steinernema carpocapsae]|uniref:Uncharacterized protein n=1 Tax=Steinernema carpocapsae TaxID=34508 RepID=A0A4V6A329_STECR|nr:hypothetical protein L596_015441 [Steinernema carpocapsae]